MYEVEQIEDGVRGETNAKIKELFLDEYYIFDGSTQRALLINKAKQKVKNKLEKKTDAEKETLFKKYPLEEDDPGLYKELFKKDKEDENEEDSYKKIKITYTPEGENAEEETVKATIDEISGSINLTHNALSAFSMLENMHTLDAEYIYHDFKELIVELNYFDKEDLVEPESQVLMFPISGISAEGWPVARHDKSEEFYGTLIHSAKDLKAKRKEAEAEIAEVAEQCNETLTEEEEEAQNNAQPPANCDTGKIKYTAEANSEGVIEAYGSKFRQFKQGNYKDKYYGGTRQDQTISGGGCGICSTAAILSGYGYFDDMSPLVVNEKLKEINLSWAEGTGGARFRRAVAV